MRNLLDTDFSDYYDQELYLPEHIPSLSLKRRKDTELTILKQIDILSSAGFRTPSKGSFLSVFSDLKLRHHQDKDWTSKTHIITNGGEVISVLDFILKKRGMQESVAEFNLAPNNKIDFFRYIQVGCTHFWIHIKSSGKKIFESPPLPTEQLVYINKPLFSIDFFKAEDGVVATGFSDAPLLRGTGIEHCLTPIEAARLITLGLETNCEKVLEFAVV